ncbi:RNA-binding S4 domain-containing protein [Vibrio intestinalis]|uniref:RNA-binding S4 domain-containing protein n=1 Tax=Vibrio intestinalis TaxID=2933291 RepID=UPI0021A92956|nr:RNA-binding S4 domain-containing protein [Vibrio intestinalis]
MSEYQGDADWQDQEEEIEIEAIGIDVSSHPIELYKVFKIANLVGGGGEAKHLIAEGYVAVNGELETRKRRKMYDGDFFEFNQEYYVVVCDAPVTEPEPKAPREVKAEKAPAKSRKDKPSKGKKANKPSLSKAKSAATKSVDKPKEDKPARSSNGRSSIDFF